MYKRQNYIENIRPFFHKPLIKVISGIRRSGKSSLLELLKELFMEEGANANQILYINMESFENRHLKSGDALYKFIKKKKKEIKKTHLLAHR